MAACWLAHLGDSDQPTVFNTGQAIFGWVRAFEEEGDERYREQRSAPPTGCATSWMMTAAGAPGARR
ncbi:MAG: hypothetical protein MZV65_28280 [Chromatiales bacterium]|nr:hypothetical protein [Chromatiales bacterium]